MIVYRVWSSTICQRSSEPFYKVSYHIKLVTWTHSIIGRYSITLKTISDILSEESSSDGRLTSLNRRLIHIWKTICGNTLTISYLGNRLRMIVYRVGELPIVVQDEPSSLPSFRPKRIKRVKMVFNLIYDRVFLPLSLMRRRGGAWMCPTYFFLFSEKKKYFFAW